MTERSRRMIEDLDPSAQGPFTDMASLLDSTIGEDAYIIFEGRRSKETQEAYFAQGRESLDEVNEKRMQAGLYRLSSEKQNYKITWTMRSKHLEGKAMDILPVDGRGNPTWDLAHYRGRFEAIRTYGEEAGLECGADWPDPQTDWPHYQVKE